MTFLEFMLGFFNNLQVFLQVMAIIGAMATAALAMGASINAEFSKETFIGNLQRYKAPQVIGVSVVCGILACLPNTKDIWRVRIDLVKLELSSPQNLSKAAETIERIGAKLECKYLGCSKEEREKKD